MSTPLRLMPSLANANETSQSGDGSVRVPSSFGAANTTWGMDPSFMGDGYDAQGYYRGERAAELDYRSKFFRARQHDNKPFDMDGRLQNERGRSFAGASPFLASAGDSSYVPLSARRPSAPYRLPRLIVNAFTGMLYGHNRWPGIRSTDADSQVFGEAVAKACDLRNRMVRARNIAGSCGTAALSWCFRNGKPVVRVHGGRFVHVLEWEDVDGRIAAHATELYQSMATRRGKDGTERYTVWCRRDWTPTVDIVFKPIEVTEENPTTWVVDEENTHEHNDNEAHFVWLENFPDDEDPSSVDGQPDYAELYEQIDTIDMMNSVLVRGVVLNLDPTLLLKMNAEETAGAIIKKGSDNALIVGETGDASYMTLPAEVVTAGREAVDMQRRQVLEVAQCVVADPDKVAAASLSAVSQRLMYAPMIGASDLLREPNGRAIALILNQMRRSASKTMGTQRGDEIVDIPVTVENDTTPSEVEDAQGATALVLENDDLDPSAQEPERVEYYLDLPPRMVSEPELDAEGQPTGRDIQHIVPVHPGAGEITLEWGEYFPPTMLDRQQNTQAVSTAAGAKPLLSQRTGVEITAALYNQDATVEWERVQDEQRQQAARVEGLTPDMGGPVADENELPPGATPMHDPEDHETNPENDQPAPEPQAPAAPTGDPNAKNSILGVADIGAVVTVNEARASIGLGPLLDEQGNSDPDGRLTVEAFKAKSETKGAAQGSREGGGTPSGGDQPPPFGGAY